MLPLRLPHTALLCCSLASVHPSAYLGFLNITGPAKQRRPYPGMPAWRQRQHLQILQEKENKGPGEKGEPRTWGRKMQGAAGCAQPSAPRENHRAEKAKDLNHGRRRGKYVVLSRVLSNRGAGTSEHALSGARWVTHTQEPRSPQAQPATQREEMLSSRRGRAPRPLQISPADAEASPKYSRDAFSRRSALRRGGSRSTAGGGGGGEASAS